MAAPATTSSSAAHGADTLIGGDGNDIVDGRPRRRRRSSRRGRRHVRLEPGRRQRHGRGPGRLRHAGLQRRQRRREHRHLRQWRSRALLPRRRQRHHGPQWRRADQLQCPGRRRQRSPSTISPAPTSRRSTSTWRPPAAAGDGAADAVIVNGTGGDDAITVGDRGGVIAVNGLRRRREHRGCRCQPDQLDGERPRRRRHDRRLRPRRRR